MSWNIVLSVMIFPTQFVVEALRGGEGPPLARYLVATLPSLLQLQVLVIIPYCQFC